MANSSEDAAKHAAPGRRRSLVLVALAGLAVVALAIGIAIRIGASGHAQPTQASLKVGDQRGAIHALMQAAGVLGDTPYKIEWDQMPAAAPLLEALSAGAIDLGGVGGAPFAFAYSNGAPIKVVLASRITELGPDTAKSAAIVAPKDSPIRTVADLRGRKLATIKGSAGQDIALRILEQAGVDPKSVHFVYLNNGDAKAALSSGAIDAWSTWGTYVGIAVEENGDRILQDAGQIMRVGSLSGFQAASDKALASKPAVLRDFLARYVRAREWARTHREDYAAAIARETGVPVAVARYSTATVLATEFTPIDASLLDEQRQTFERYVRAGVIDRIPPLDATGYDPVFNDLVTPKPRP